jgi:hypothetical protein
MTREEGLLDEIIKLADQIASHPLKDYYMFVPFDQLKELFETRNENCAHDCDQCVCATVKGTTP